MTPHHPAGMFLGIEIGGTKLQLGLGQGDGVMGRLWRGGVDPSAGGAGIRRQISAAVPELLDGAGLSLQQVGGIGIGFGGPVDDATQSIVRSHQIDGWEDFPIAQWLKDTFSLPVALGNDADVAGLAEASFGAGKGLAPIFYVTVGSGIGGGFIVDGRIYRGVGRGAAEIGHLRVYSPEGEYVPLEHVASGWGMETRARKHGKNWTARQIADESARDRLARSILDDAHAALAEAICHVVTLLCPRRIVIGGGVSLMGEDLFFAPLRKAVAARQFVPFAGLTDIVPAALGEEVVVHGALALARQRFGT
jgi:glucokinase